MDRKFLEACVLTVLAISFLLAVCSGSDALAQGASKPIQVCATVPDLGNLVQEIGGDQVGITVFAKGREDPHFVEAKPSFIKALSQADLYVQIGMELETGWAPVLLQNARNGRVLPGAAGFLDASKAVTALEVPAGAVDRSMGDVHPMGNPHYLLDPLNGVRVARLIRDRLSELRPGKTAFFEESYSTFCKKAGKALMGDALSNKYDVGKLASLYEAGRLGSFLKEQKEETSPEGWVGMMLPYSGNKVVSDHNLWPYFARRFGVQLVEFLEPKPGLTPTTKHLQAIIDRMRSQGIKVILASPYFDLRHAQFVAKNTGARIAELAHQVGSRPGTENYLALIDYNVRQVAKAFAN